MLKEAEVKLKEAKAEKQDFEKGGGKSLEKLREKVLNGEVLSVAQQQLLADLIKQEERLEKRRDDWSEEVREWGKKLHELDAQQGNNFVTWVLGT